MASFSEAFASKLGESWFATVATPAFGFWVGGLVAWLWKERESDCAGRLREMLTNLDDSVLWVIAIGGLLVVLASGVLVDRLSFGVLRVLEGYWPRPLATLRGKLIAGRNGRLAMLEERIQVLLARAELEADEQDELSRLEMSLARAPADLTLRMPTRLGNVLRAAEARPNEKYGLDAVVCWSRLWLVMPGQAKAELQEARSAMDADVGGLSWACLLFIWTVYTWWAIPVAVAAVLLTNKATLGSAVLYSDLLEASFDLYRFDLYRALAWPLPSNPAVERESGRRLTEYLWRGSTDTEPAFSPTNEGS